MSKIGLIIQREYNQRVKKKSFILTTLLTPILMVALMVVPMLIAIFGGSSERSVVVVDNSGVIADKLVDNESINFIISDDKYPEVAEKHKDVFGYLVIDADVVTNASKLALYTRESATLDVEKELKNQVQDAVESIRVKQSGVEGIDSMLAYFNIKIPIQTYSIGESIDQVKESSSRLSMGVAYISGFVIYMFIFLYGAMVMQGVIEEKSSRIIEVIVSSVKPFELMMGKIIGIALVALTQVVIWVAVVVVGMLVVGQIMAPDPTAVGAAVEMSNQVPHEMAGVMSAVSDLGYLARVLGAFVIFFMGGYLLYASMFAAVGSGVDNVADTQQLQMPITMPLILAIVLMMAVMKEPNSAMAFWFSMIPFTSPIIMMARVAYGVPLWEFVLSVTLLFGTFVLMTMFAAKIYRVGIFMYGKKPSLKELIKWSKFKS